MKDSRILSFLVLGVLALLLGRNAYSLYVNNTDSGMTLYIKESVNGLLEKNGSGLRIKELKNLVNIGDETECQQYFEQPLTKGGKCYESIAVIEKDGYEMPLCIYSEQGDGVSEKDARILYGTCRGNMS